MAHTWAIKLSNCIIVSLPFYYAPRVAPFPLRSPFPSPYGFWALALTFYVCRVFFYLPFASTNPLAPATCYVPAFEAVFVGTRQLPQS